MKHQKQWDSTQQDQSVHQLNDFERVQKKASRVSKNINAAREEWLAKQEALRKGKIPEEMKKIIQPQPKKYTASAYAIQKDPKNRNNKSSLSQATLKRKESVVRETKPRQGDTPANYASLRTTVAPRDQIDMHFNSFNKLDAAMADLELAMKSGTVEYDQDEMVNCAPKQEDISAVGMVQEDWLSDDSMFDLSPEGTPTKAAAPPTQLVPNPTMDLAAKYEDLMFSNEPKQPTAAEQQLEVRYRDIERSREVLQEIDQNQDQDDLGDVGMLAKMLEDTRNTLKTMDIVQDEDGNESDENEEEKYANSFFHIPKSIVAPTVPQGQSLARNDDEIQPWKCPIKPQPQVRRFNDASDSFALVDYTRKPNF